MTIVWSPNPFLQGDCRCVSKLHEDCWARRQYGQMLSSTVDKFIVYLNLKKCGGEGQSEEQEEKLKQKPCDGRGAMTWVTSGVWHLVHGREYWGAHSYPENFVFSQEFCKNCILEC